MNPWNSSETVSSWLRASEERARMMGPATERMLALADLREGSRVLDLGTGVGDVAVLAAKRVGPKGYVLATDASSGMIEAAAAAAKSANLDNVETRVAQAEALALDEASFDAVVARNVLMLVADVTRALSEVCRVLRPGGHFAAITWADLGRNPFNGILVEAVEEHGRLPEEPPELMRAFSMNDPSDLKARLEASGMREVRVERVHSMRVFPALEAAVTLVRESPTYQDMFTAMSGDEKARVLLEMERRSAEFKTAEGAIRFPIESLVCVGSK